MAPTTERTVPEGWFLWGLFLTTLATLALEILDTRLLSVLALYHLSFFAVSIAMFGMAAGAVHVYLSVDRFSAAAAPAALARWSSWFAVSVPVTHVINLIVPVPIHPSVPGTAAIGFTTLVLAVPFFLSGVIVTVALTRIRGSIGRIYATDLAGAALGCLLVIPLLRYADISSATFALGALGALGSLCFGRFAGSGGMRLPAVLAVALLAAFVLNGSTRRGFRVIYPKGSYQAPTAVSLEAWNTYSQVVAMKPQTGPPFYWSARRPAGAPRLVTLLLSIDGLAGTLATQWDGNVESLDWVRHDVTSLPYHLRKGGDAAVIGVGGGRDVLTALWAKSRSVVGIEMNEALLRFLRGPLRQFVGLADHRDVLLVADEARSYLTRSSERFDVLQMSLIDTWAATGAGAYTLSENGLYTLEAWRVFLGVLKPGGLFSISRWFSPNRVSETSRIAALATGALLERGIRDPARHVALVARGSVATLLLSVDPLSSADLDAIEHASSAEGFTIVFSPRQPAGDELLAAVFASRSSGELAAAVADEPFDYSPPTDARPYFFNMLRPMSLFRASVRESAGITASGNLLATVTLAILAALSLILVASMILFPLWRAGTPPMPPGVFRSAILYFSLIGIGFMMVQIPCMQRFSVYLGHPTYAIAVILFSMILFAGLGSLLSDRMPVETRPGWVTAVSLLAAALVGSATALLQPLIDVTVRLDLPARCAVVVLVTALPSLLLGTCFPSGMRLVRPFGERAMPWMWGVNGACGVLASVAAVAISMWVGIEASLAVAVLCYALLPLPARVLASCADGSRSALGQTGGSPERSRASAVGS